MAKNKAIYGTIEEELEDIATQREQAHKNSKRITRVWKNGHTQAYSART